MRIAFDAVLVAVGRVANLKGYGLEELGIPAERTVGTNAYVVPFGAACYSGVRALPIHASGRRAPQDEDQ